MTPAYTKLHSGGGLIVSFISTAEAPISVLAANGEQAVHFALLLISEREVLRSGDLIYIYKADSTTPTADAAISCRNEMETSIGR